MGVFHPLRQRPQESRPKCPQKFPSEQTIRKKEKRSRKGESEPFERHLSPIASPNLLKPLYRGAERGEFDSYTESEWGQAGDLCTPGAQQEIFKRGRGREKIRGRSPVPCPPPTIESHTDKYLKTKNEYLTIQISILNSNRPSSRA